MTPKQKKRLRLRRRQHNQPNKGKRSHVRVQYTTWRATRPKFRTTIPWR